MIKLLLSLILFFVFSGCISLSIDTDGDGVVDYKDVCKNTPLGAKVNKQGCAYDTDFDGVIDLYDKCPNTKYSELVNKFGCVVKTIE